MISRHLPDEQLVSLYQHTQAADCFATLYRRYVRKVYTKCFAFTQDAETAEDFTQDIFIKVLNSLNSFQQRSKFSTWLFAISNHYCLDQLRLGRRMVWQEVGEGELAQLPDPDGLDRPDESLDELVALARNMPDGDRLLLHLKYAEGHSIREIATMCTLSESAVKMRLKRTRDRLHERYLAMLA
ncbi:RNA polymerase sigma factor [Spirosoma luteolum]